MRKFKHTSTLLIIILLTTTINAQVEPDKGKTASDKKESSWGKIVGNSNEDYENVVLGKCVSGDCENGYGKREKSLVPNETETYEGNFKDSKLSGQGTYIEFNDENGTWVDGYAKLKYIGNWEQNKRVGQGVETRYDADDKIIYKYDGSWENDKKNGAGKEYIDGVLVYEGKFKNNFRTKDSGCITGDCENGYGVFIYPNKNKYIGEFKNGLKNGFGIETDPEGYCVYGNWKDNKEEGYVRIFDKNNELIFSGEVRSGKPVQNLGSSGEEYGCTIGNCTDGFGHYLLDNGDKYIGEWENSIMQGYGTYLWIDNTKYVGEFIKGQLDGYGTEYDANGQITKSGEYVAGAYVGEIHSTEERAKCTVGNCGSGFGVMVVELSSGWEHGYRDYKNDFESKYEGMWVSEFKNEIGFLEDKDGNTYVGQFKQDEFEGQGVSTFANGDQYIGSFEEGAMTGFGTMTYTDGSKYVGEWSYNKKRRAGKEYDKNGKLLYSGDFYNNERDD